MAGFQPGLGKSALLELLSGRGSKRRQETVGVARLVGYAVNLALCPVAEVCEACVGVSSAGRWER